MGTYDKFCKHCNAFKFENELHFKCCHSGKVSLQPLKDFPGGLTNPTNENLHKNTEELIQNILNDVSPYAASYKWMAQVENEEQLKTIEEKRPVSSITMIVRAGVDRRRCNAPLHKEVGGVFTGEDGAPPAARDIVIYPRDQPLQRISCTSPHIDPMAHPLIFPKGDFGWDINLSHNGEFASAVRNRVTQSQFSNWGHSKSTFAQIWRFLTPLPPLVRPCLFLDNPPPPLQYVR